MQPSLSSSVATGENSRFVVISFYFVRCWKSASMSKTSLWRICSRTPIDSAIFLSSGREASATSFPFLMMMARSHTASTSCIMCVERSTVFVFLQLFISERISTSWLGSRPVVGSSRIGPPDYGSWLVQAPHAAYTRAKEPRFFCCVRG